jgi:hypothetical protein
VTYDLCDLRPVWPTTCVTYDLCDLRPVWPMTCVTYDLCDLRPVHTGVIWHQGKPGISKFITNVRLVPLEKGHVTIVYWPKPLWSNLFGCFQLSKLLTRFHLLASSLNYIHVVVFIYYMMILNLHICFTFHAYSWSGLNCVSTEYKVSLYITVPHNIYSIKKAQCWR